MTAYFTHLSVEMPMSAEAASEAVRFLRAVQSHLSAPLKGRPSVQTDPDVLGIGDRHDGIFGHGLRIAYNDEAGHLVIEDDDGSPNLDVLEAAIKILIGRLDLDEPITVEWSETCDRAQAGAFGGGAMVVSRDHTFSMTTGRWAQDMRHEMMERTNTVEYRL